ncbi:hypothetical protein [Streptomyces sp. NEAU-NA10]|uniref:hypothetical protein n=1 Tax=Streptomyces sp. NEAU-NA10 TaxID=3416050 RepID=UPI003CC5CDA0
MAVAAEEDAGLLRPLAAQTFVPRGPDTENLDMERQEAAPHRLHQEQSASPGHRHPLGGLHGVQRARLLAQETRNHYLDPSGHLVGLDLDSGAVRWRSQVQVPKSPVEAGVAPELTVYDHGLIGRIGGHLFRIEPVLTETGS